jgi:Zinc carboxypeptidase
LTHIIGHIPDKVRNYEDLKKIGLKAVEAIKATHGKVYVTGSSIETIYPNSGSSMDFVYANYDIPITFTIELRGPKDTPNLFILPAKEITPTAEEIVASFIAALKEARSLGYYSRDEL